MDGRAPSSRGVASARVRRGNQRPGTADGRQWEMGEHYGTSSEAHGVLDSTVVVEPGRAQEAQCHRHHDALEERRRGRRLHRRGDSPRWSTATLTTPELRPLASCKTPAVYRFNDVEIYRRAVRSDASVLPCTSNRRRLISSVLSIEHRDRVVAKTDLLDGVWGHRFLSEASLTTCIKEAWRAVGDDGASQHTIRNARARGDRFVVRLVGDVRPWRPVQPRSPGAKLTTQE